MKKQFYLGSGIVMIIGLNYFLDRDISRSRETKPQNVSYGQSKEAAQMMTSVNLNKSKRSLSSTTQEEMKTFRSSFPDKDDMKLEVSKNPHATPRSLIHFAEKMGPLYEKALQDKEYATSLVDEFHNCLMDDSIALSARTLCLSNAEKLAKVYPQLEDKVSIMRESAPVEVSILREQKKGLILK